MDCLFCKIVEGEIAANVVLENDTLMAFHDISPQAPHHILIIPKKHIATINDVQKEDEPLMGQMIRAAQSIAKTLGIDEEGYRLLFNVNEGGGQMVYHIHLHLLGGRPMTWPPG